MDDDQPRPGRTGQDLVAYRLATVERQLRDLSERHLREVRDEAALRARELSEQNERRIREVNENLGKSIRDLEESADQRIGKVEKFLLSGLGLVATLFIGALFALVTGNTVGGGPG